MIWLLGIYLFGLLFMAYYCRFVARAEWRWVAIGSILWPVMLPYCALIFYAVLNSISRGKWRDH